MSASKIFTGYRALGYVSTDVPLTVRYHRKHKENYVVTAVGNAFHVYNCSKLGIVSVSDIHPGPITVLSASQRHIFTACGKTLRCFDKGRKVIHVYKGHQSDVRLLLPFGAHLVSVDCTGHVIVWDAHSEEVFLKMEFDVKTFDITAIAHPYGFTNKILLGSRQGSLQLWNIKRSQLIHTFTGWNQQVTVLEQSPAVDVLAVGLADGNIHLHNFREDATLMTFFQDWGPVTTISFRTDNNPTMVTGSAMGHMAFWNLESKKLISQQLEAHNKAVASLYCLPQQPLMVSNAGDNTLKVWIFDQPDGGIRLLRFREGHSAPPNFLRHYGTLGQKILCAGQDSTVRMFSTVHDKYNSSLGRASFNKAETKKSGLKHDQHKMPPITVFAAESNRESDWDSVAACHRGLRMVTTWSTVRSTMGKHKLDCKRFHHGGQHRLTTAQCVDISSCGNFVAVGYSSGHLDIYNMQSGKHRGSFGDPVAHTSGVRGVAFDAYNSILITAGADSDLKFWRFGSRDRDRKLLKELKTSADIVHILLHRESKMLAVVQEDFVVVVIDLDTLKTVRHFSGHTNTITDLTFSGDGRWLITASMDCTVRTWSLVHGRLIDCFAVQSAVTTLSMSPTDDFLVTAHVGDLGVYLWANKALYSFVSLQPLPDDYEPAIIHMPATAERPDDVESEDQDVDKMEYESAEFKSPEQINEDLITLSQLPTSRWLNLLYLDVIQMRNKPKDPPKVPKSAPFFLPTVAGLDLQFAKPEEDKEEEKSNILRKPDLHSGSEFGQMLMKASSTNYYEPVMSRLKGQGAFAIDGDIRSLEKEEEFLAFFDWVLHVMERRCDFDLISGYLALFIKVHFEALQDSDEIADRMERILQAQEQGATKMDEKLKQNLSLGEYMCSAKLA